MNLRLSGLESAPMTWWEADAVVRALVRRGRGVAWEEFARADGRGAKPDRLPLLGL